MPNTLRSCIIAEEGYTFISLDASQIELRVLAIMSGDPQMLEDLATGDLHMATAIRMLGLVTADNAPLDMTPEEKEAWAIAEMKRRRYIAKQSNFADVYGADEYKLAEMLECSVDEALEFKEERKATYPRLYEWMDEKTQEARENGFVVNMFGRIRQIPELYAGSWRMREKAERECVNTIIQGSAVDIVKKMMLYMRGRLDKRVRLVLQVHDEMVWECPDELFNSSLRECRGLLSVFPEYPVTIKTGKIYGELTDEETGLE